MEGSGQSFDVFFSYHWRDHVPVEAVARALTERGLRVFLDRWYLTPGQPWPQALERTLASCHAVAVFLGADGLGPWQQRERDLALDRQGQEPGFPVIPVLLTRADPALGFLKLNTWVDLSANVADQAALEILCAAIHRQPPGPAGLQQIAAVRAEICPYRGLRPFREEDAAYFCGREAFTEKLVEAVERSSLVAVMGASGSGKSSVVRAGLIPRLRQTKAGQVWEIAILVPNDRPLHSLAAALIPILEPEMTRIDRLAEINKLASHFTEGAVALRDVAADVLRAQPGTDRLLLFVDQWEELYTLVADDGARRRFLAEVLDASATGAVTVVLTLRGDFFGQALSDRALADRLQDSQVNLGPMTKEELRCSIVEPAEKAGLQFEPGLVDRILEDVGQEPGNLPLLEFVLAALWEQRQGVTLLHAAYERMGGVEGAIAARANAEFEKLDAAQQDAARHVLIQMVRPGEATEDTRQRALLPSGNETALAVIRRLADARLVVTARNAATGEETVEVTHEALIRNWSLLRGWVDADREFLRTKARIESAAALWEQEKRDPSRLLPAGCPLTEGKEILANRRADLSPSVVAFIELSAAVAARAHRRVLFIRAAVLAAVWLAVAGGGLYWDLYSREHEQYYNAYAKRWNVLEGVGPVSADEAAHRSWTLRFTRKGRLGPIVRVDATDGSGACARAGIVDLTTFGGADPLGIADNPTRVCSLVWDRDSKGRVSRQTMLDAARRVAATLVFPAGDGRMAEIRAEAGRLLRLGAATTINFEFFEDGPNRGQVRLEHYTDSFSQPKPFQGNVFGARAEYDPRGLLVRAVFLDRTGKPMRNAAGIAEVRVIYDSSSRPIEVSHYDEGGHLIRAKSGVARRTLTYDARGNLVKEEFFDEAERPAPSEQGFAKVTFAYDARGKEIERKYYDDTGKLTLSRDGYAQITKVFDQDGRPVETSYFDEAGKPTLSNDRYARVVKRYDELGNLVVSTYFDEVGNPTLSKDGYAKVMSAFDDRGNQVEAAYFDEAGKPTLSNERYARVVTQYDESGNPIVSTYFDEAGKPTLFKKGIAKIMRKYDGAAQVIEEAYFDETGKPTLHEEGYTKVTKTYDEQGNQLNATYFDADDNLILSKRGFASQVFTYDQQGNMVRRQLYDEKGKPILSKDGKFASLTRNYDSRGNIIEEANFDESGKPCLDDDGVARTIIRYDELDNRVEQAFFDEEGKPTLSNEGVAVIARKYDARSNLLVESYFDEKGNPTRAPSGDSMTVRVFDSRSRIVEETYLDGTGELTAIDLGYAKITASYDARGNQIENRCFDEGGKPTRSKDGIGRMVFAYDQRGNQTEQAYFDEWGRPTLSKTGYAKLTRAFDARGNQVEEAYFDVAGKLTRSADGGYAKVKMAHDARGNVVEGRYYDENERPAPNVNGVSRWTQVFDARGNVVEVRNYDENERPVSDVDGVFRWTIAYDARGNRAEVAYFDEKGYPVRSNDGFARKTWMYDARDNQVEEAYFDEKGAPTRSKNGYARMTRVYDARGNVVVEEYFDEKGHATRSNDGFAKITKTYNTRRELVQQARFDEKGRPIPDPQETTF